MRAPTFLVDFVRWRWTPSVVLVSGSLAFVGFAVLIVPDDLGAVASGADRLSRAARQGVAKKAEAVGDDSTQPITEEPAAGPAARATPNLHAPPAARNIVQSIFHPTPKVELPIEPVDPNPPPPPPEPPPPAPTQTVYTLENPPPVPAPGAPVPGDPGFVAPPPPPPD